MSVLITRGLANHLENVDTYDNLEVLQVDVNRHNLLGLSREELNPVRNKVLAPFGIKFDAPSMVSLYLMGDDVIVIENFRDESVSVTLETEFPIKADVKLTLPASEVVEKNFGENKLEFSNKWGYREFVVS